MDRLTLLFLTLVPSIAFGQTTAPEERLRLEVLHAVFPGTQISRMAAPPPAEVVDDALAGEPYYRIHGPAKNQAEDCACQEIITGKRSLDREVRLRVVPRAKSLFAVLQYEFIGASPAAACWTLGMAARVAEGKIEGEYLFHTLRHGTIDSIRVLDLSGDGKTHLVVESDSGRAASGGSSSFYVFDLRSTTMRPAVIEQASYNGVHRRGIAEIDIPRTRLRKARALCMIETTTFDPEHRLLKPKISRHCDPIGTGLTDNADTQDWLKPQPR